MVNRRRARLVSEYFSDPFITLNYGGSRAIVTAPHCNPADTGCADVLSIAYQTLIYSTLVSRSPSFSLNPSSLVQFVETVLKELPSSASTVKSYNVILFGELLVDLIWAIDSELEEVLIDIKSVVPSGNASTNANDPSKQEVIAKASKTRELIEKDRLTLSEILRGLVVGPCTYLITSTNVLR